MKPTPLDRIHEHLVFVYSAEKAAAIEPQIREHLAQFTQAYPQAARQALSPAARLTERDAVLITYGDQVLAPGEPPLQSLRSFLVDHGEDVFSGVHILPFFPYSSDDGFSVVDYKAVDPALGDWSDVVQLGRHFRLMFDAVINHISRASDWFQAFLRDEQPYAGTFITVDPGTDLSQVVRPRALPL